MKLVVMDWLVCPACQYDDLNLEIIKEETAQGYTGFGSGDESDSTKEANADQVITDVLEGKIICQGCSAEYQISGGIPRMILPDSKLGPSTPHRWTRFDGGADQWRDTFKQYAVDFEPSEFLGRLVLDAGSGYGRHAFFAARFGAHVVALDNSLDALLACRENNRHYDSVHPVMSDVCKPPFKPGLFDIAYCFGVLHHLDDPKSAFSALGKVLRSGGRLALWVYGPRNGTSGLASSGLRGVTKELDESQLYSLSKGISRALRLFSHTPYKLLNNVPIVGSVVRHLPVHDHHKWPFNVVVADVYDRLSIPVTHWFKSELLEQWLMDDGYAEVKVTRLVGNNESFRASGTKR